MATIGGDSLTLVDLLKRLDPDGGLAAIGEIMAQDQDILEDIPWVEANDITGHRTIIRTGLPEGTWRKLNAGVPTEKSTTAQITENVGMLEAYAETDVELANLSGDKNKFLLDEASAFIEGLSQTMSTSIIYGDTDIDPEKILGLTERYSDLSAGNSDNVLSAGGSSDLASIWLVNWDPKKVHGLYAKGSVAGLQFKNLGEHTLKDGDGNQYQGYRSHFQFKAGICVRDWRHVVRVCNIDTGDLTTDAATGPKLIELMVDALEAIKSTGGTARFYVPKIIRKYLRHQITNKTNVNLTMDEVAGKRVLHFDGILLRKLDALTVSEATVT